MKNMNSLLPSKNMYEKNKQLGEIHIQFVKEFFIRKT